MRRCTLLLDCGHQCPSMCGESCPDSKYCQSCGTDDILFTVVDSLGMKDYRDVNLDEDPCIFPRCGHFQTRSSMDQQLGIQDFYNLAEEGAPSSIKGVVSPFSVQEVARCTQCLASLRDISRYGRIVRRPMLDESLKELICWSNTTFLKLAERLAQCMNALRQRMDYRDLRTSYDRQSLIIELEGNMQRQTRVLRDFIGQGRYADLAILYRDIQSFSTRVRAKEEAFQKVADLTRRANENSEAAARSMGAIHQHEPFVQSCGGLLAMDLSLRCNIAVLADFLKLWKDEIAAGTFPRPTLQLDMKSNLRASQELIKRACDMKRPLLAAQGHVYVAWFCGFARALGVAALTRRQEFVPTLARLSENAITITQLPVTDEGLRRMGLQNITKAFDIHAGCSLTSRHLRDEIITTGRFVQEVCLDEGGGTDWYTAVAWALGGTGPWYVCDNGHCFMDLRVNSMFLGQLRCTECSLLVADRGRASNEAAPLDSDTDSLSEEETLVDI
ncbi:hypothetical protein SLS64_010626 [Diaporthe eres]